MKLIVERTDEVKFITEDNNGEKEFYIEGVFLQAAKKNRNGRTYPTNTLSEEVGRYNDEVIKTHRAMGELGHPSTPKINLERVSHVVQNLRQEGNDFIGRAKIINTPYGKIAKDFIKEGIKLGVSSRGMGTLKTKGSIVEVQEDYKLFAIDIVADPSAPDAFVNGIMEGREWAMNNGIITELDFVTYQKKINKAHSSQLEEVKLNVLGDFLAKLSNV